MESILIPKSSQASDDGALLHLGEQTTTPIAQAMLGTAVVELIPISATVSNDGASIWSLTSSMKCVLKEKDLYSSCWSQNLILSLPFVSTPLSTSTCLPSPRPRGPYNHEKSSKAENLIAFSSLNLASSKISCKIPS